MVRRFAILCLLLMVAGSPGEPRPLPKVVYPKTLAVPAGYVQVASFEAKGDQKYIAVERQPCSVVWVLLHPKAVLYDAKGKKVGTHTIGPTWEAEDGSKLERDPAMTVVSVPADDRRADIPWLLIRVKSTGKAGRLSKVVYVRRQNTRGGVPNEAPQTGQTGIAVPYTATYVFYAKKD